jgi:protein-S-isoprenylcysteine O-methyltransferase Ste14
VIFARSWRPQNIPLPKQYLAAIATGLLLSRIRPWTLSMPNLLRPIGAVITMAGVWLIGRSVRAAADVEVEDPDRLVIAAPYTWTRNPMYVGWGMMHLGVGFATRSGWVLAALPAAAARTHREVLAEERALQARFGEEFETYRVAVPRYLPSARRPRAISRRLRGL